MFEKVEELTPERAKDLIQGTLRLFKELKSQMASKDPIVRAEAIKKAKEAKPVLELQMKQLVGSVHLNSLFQATEKQVSPSEKDQAVLKTIREEVVKYKKELLPRRKRNKVTKLVC